MVRHDCTNLLVLHGWSNKVPRSRTEGRRRNAERIENPPAWAWVKYEDRRHTPAWPLAPGWAGPGGGAPRPRGAPASRARHSAPDRTLFQQRTPLTAHRALAPPLRYCVLYPVSHGTHGRVYSDFSLKLILTRMYMPQRHSASRLCAGSRGGRCTRSLCTLRRRARCLRLRAYRSLRRRPHPMP